MIAASGIELRAGPASCSTARPSASPPATGSGSSGRNGAGKTTLTKVLAGQGQPAAGSVTATGEVGLPPAGPAHRRPARPGPRPHPVRPRARPDHHADARVRGRDGQRRRRDARQGDAPLRPARGGVHRPGRVCRGVRGRDHRQRPGARRARARAAARRRCPVASAAGSSCPASCSPARQTLLLDEPTNHLDADSIGWLRDYLKRLPGRARGHQPRRRAARRRRQPGVPPRRQPRPSSTSTTSAGSPTSSSARPTSGAASASAPTPRRRPPP